MLDDVEFDHDTHEYRINGGDWINALAVDDTGVSVDYPELVSLVDDELSSLAPIIRDLVEETGIAVRARRVAVRSLFPGSERQRVGCASPK